MGSQFDLFLFYIWSLENFLPLQFTGGICSFFTHAFFYPPEVDHLWWSPMGSRYEILFVLFLPLDFFFHIFKGRYQLIFDPANFLFWQTDGWWFMDGSQKDSPILLKIFSDEIQVILICCYLENLWKTFFYRKKIQLQLSKSEVFLIKFRMGNRCFFSLKILSDEAQVI